MKNNKRRNTNQNLKLKSVLKESEDKKFITSLIKTLNDAYDEVLGKDSSDDFFNQISEDTPLNLLYKDELESLGVFKKLKNIESPEPDNTGKKELWNSFILELEKYSKHVWEHGDKEIAKRKDADLTVNLWKKGLSRFFDNNLRADAIEIYTEDKIEELKESFIERCLAFFRECWSISPSNEERDEAVDEDEDEITNLSKFFDGIKEIFPEPSSEESSAVPKCPDHPDVTLEPKKKGWYCDECDKSVLTYDDFPKPDDSPKP